MRSGKRKWRLMKKQVGRPTTIKEGKTEEEKRQLWGGGGGGGRGLRVWVGGEGGGEVCSLSLRISG